MVVFALAVVLMIELHVQGDPMPKGSKTAVVRNGRAVLLDARRTPALIKFGRWKAAIAYEATSVMAGAAPLDGALAITAVFYLRHPKSETRAQRARTWHTVKPDADKLLRAVLDPLSGIAIADDARIAHAIIEKRYVDPGKLPGAYITISQLTQGD